MELMSAAALVFLLSLQAHNTGALPVVRDAGKHEQEASRIGFLMKETGTALPGKEKTPCQIFPVTDDPPTGITPPLISVSKPGQEPCRTVPPPAPGGKQDPNPPPLPPNVYYVLPPNGGSFHSSFGQPGSLPVHRWFLDLLKKHHQPVRKFPQSNANPTGGFDSTSSQTSSDEDD